MNCTFCTPERHKCVHDHPVFVKPIERNRQIVDRMHAYRAAGRHDVAEAFRNMANAYGH